MKYDGELWNKYTDDNKDHPHDEVSKFLYFVFVTLGAKKILEAGCNIGNNLAKIPKDFEIHAIDLNEQAIDIAKKKYPYITFKIGNLNKISYPDSFFDLVFTRNVLIHVPKNEVDDILKQLLRVSKKWIINIEYFGKDGEMINWKRGDDLLWYRNMKERWSKFDVEILSDNEIPVDIDFGKSRLTLVRKR